MAHLGHFFIALNGVLMASSLTAATLTVDLNGGVDYTAIQPAIDAAADGDTVLVKPGEYVITEPINFNRLHKPDDPSSPPVKNIVVKSEGGAEVTTIRMAETPTDLNRASVVVFESGEANTCVLDGLTITSGRGTKCGPEFLQIVGGGVLCMNNSSPTLASCTISGNTANDGGGGGVCCSSGSSPTLTNCTIIGNLSDGSSDREGGKGGGVYCYGGSPTLTSCTISGNWAEWDGGGVWC